MITLSPPDHYHYSDDGTIYAKSVKARYLPPGAPVTSRDDRLDRVVRPASPAIPLRFALTLRDLLDVPILRGYHGELVRIEDDLAVVVFGSLHSAASWGSSFEAVTPEDGVSVYLAIPTPRVTFCEPVTVHVRF